MQKKTWGPACLGIATGLIFGLALSATPSASAAGTPDGETPAEEATCDSLDGAEYGLCTAFCEAMDCHYHYDGDDSTEANADLEACERIWDNFLKHAGTDPPCLGGGNFEF